MRGIIKSAALLRYAGYGCCVAWGFLLNAVSEFQIAEGMSNFVIATVPGLFAGLLLLAFSSRICIGGGRTPFVFICAVLAASGTFVMALPKLNNSYVEYAGATIAGFFFMGLLATWFVAYARLSVREVFFCSALSIATAALICVLLSCCPVEAASLGMAVLPLVALLLLPKAQFGDRWLHAKSEFVLARDVKTKIPIRALSGLALLYFALDTMRSMGRVPESFLGRADAAFLVFPLIAAALCAIVAYFRKTEVGFGSLPEIVLLGIALSLICMYIFSSPQYNFGSGFSLCASVLCWMFLLFVVKRNNLNPLPVFCFGWMAEFLGGCLAQSLIIILEPDLTVVSFVLALMMTISVVFMFSNENFILPMDSAPQSKYTTSRVPRNESPLNNRDSNSITRQSDYGAQYEQLLSHFCAQYALTSRESDVFRLWITGHGMKYIQETLVVSQGTVKTHLRNIYEKCGVHSRDELVRIFEKERNDSSES